MKKLLFLFITIFTALTSCSSDDDNSSDSVSPILIKKIIPGTLYGEPNSTEFTYDGNKMVSSISVDGMKNVYTYTGDLITKGVLINRAGEIYITTEFGYTNGKLSSKIEKRTEDSVKKKTEYTHNTDGTISFEVFTVNVTTGVQTHDYAGKYTYKDGNLIRVEYEDGYYGSSTYEYDTKNSPFKNVLGFNLLLGNNSINNVVKHTYDDYDAVTHSYSYDANGFPTEESMISNGTLLTARFIY